MISKLTTLILVFFFPVAVHAAIDWDIYDGSHVIADGDQYDSVSIFNAATLSMTGGEFFDLYTYDDATASFSGGQLSFINAYHNSIINFSGGQVVEIVSADFARINLRGGVITRADASSADSSFHVYGYSFSITNNSSLLAGYWADGSPFQIEIRRGNLGYIDRFVLHEIPEPASFALMGFCIIGLIRHRTVTKQAAH